MSKGAQKPPLPRVHTHVRRLDDILHGGLMRGSSYSIVGPPGSGKTILANQLCFNHSRLNGGRCVYFTLLAESHTKMFRHLSSLTFFEPQRIPDEILYVSGYHAWRTAGLAPLMALIRGTVREQRASMLVLDGLESLPRGSADTRAFREFVNELQGCMHLLGCTTLLLSVAAGDREDVIGSLVDGCLELTDLMVGPRAVRELTVHKFRGSGYLRGRHELEVLDQGIVIHPRTEVQFDRPGGDAQEARQRMAFGLPRLDKMLGGGLPSGSCAALLGAPGTGKTMLGVAFLLEGARQGQQGTYFGFYEPPPRLIDKAEGIGLPLRRYVEQGLIDLVWQPPLEHMLDALAEELIEPFRLCKRPRRRAFVDGIEGFRAASVYSRMGLFLAALVNQLRTLDVTTVFSEELELFAAAVAPPNAELANVVETVLMLRHMEVASRLDRLISVMKMRESSYDPTIRQFEITSRGLHIGRRFPATRGLLSGQPQSLVQKRRAPANKAPP